jgi:hypothetical protein
MAQKPTPKTPQTEYDSVYFLKILIYLILGSLWLAPDGRRLIPIGLILGLLVVQHEKLQIDRKIEYAILLVGTILGLVGIGITVTV